MLANIKHQSSWLNINLSPYAAWLLLDDVIEIMIEIMELRVYQFLSIIVTLNLSLWTGCIGERHFQSISFKLLIEDNHEKR